MFQMKKILVALTLPLLLATGCKYISNKPIQADELLVEPEAATVGCEGGRVQMTVTANISIGRETSVEWIHFTDKTKSSPSTKYEVIVDPNPDAEERTGEVVFFNAGKTFTKTLTITQGASTEPKPFIEDVFTRNFNNYGIYDLKDPDKPTGITSYVELDDQMAYGTGTSSLIFRIQNLEKGYMTGFLFGSASPDPGTKAQLTVTTVGTKEGSADGNYNAVVARHAYGRIWLEDTEAKMGFIMRAE